METTATNQSDLRAAAPGRSGDPRGRRIFAKIEYWAGSMPTNLRLGIIVSGILAVGNLDFATGDEVSFSIFYLLPIAAAARFQDRKTAARLAVFAGIVWFTVELLSHPEFSQPWIPLWNATTRTMFFLLLVAYVTGIRRRDEVLEDEVRRQTAAMREMMSSRRTLEREMAQAVAREHTQIARELHDGVGQYLAGLALRARSLADGLKQEGSEHAVRSEELVEKLTTTNRMLRRLDHILSPAISTEGGLPIALGRLAADVRQFSGVECELTLPETPVMIGEFQALTLFRIAQEAISNSVKHSGVRSIRLDLAVDSAGLRLAVIDRGRGFALPSSSDAGEGLRIMRHRADLIGARMEIRSAKGAGCTVECVLPWRGAAPVAIKGD